MTEKAKMSDETDAMRSHDDDHSVFIGSKPFMKGS